MSETTPDPTNDASQGVPDNGFAPADTEPSMEDILASIRKIIADDADPVPLDGPVVDAAPLSDTIRPEVVSDADASAIDLAPMDFQPSETDADLDDDMLDLDALLTEMEVIEPVADMTAGEPSDVTAFADDALSIPTPEPEPISEPAAEPVASVQPDIDDAPDEMDQLMNELLVGLDEELPPAELVVDDVQTADVSVPAAQIDTGEELDLVKSLMADLTDDDLAGAVQTDDSLIQADADLAIPPEPVTSDTEEDILDSILNMTLEDEIAALEAQVEAEKADLGEEPVAESVPSLADIAAAADADAAEPGVDDTPSAAPVMAAAAAGAALLGGATLAASDDPVETPDETSEPETQDPKAAAPAEAQTPARPAIQDTPKVETPMSSALRSDAILDDVTEEAAMSAFAELNNVVEEKAVFNERGPRIGDLVQEALKPMLKEWLDANLKGIVERAVAKEVKRISTGK